MADKEKSEGEMSRFPVVPLRDMVAFPSMVVPLFVGRKTSIEAVMEAVAASGRVLLVTQRDAEVEEPSYNDLYSVGTVANILQHLELADGTIKILVEGLYRAKIDNFVMDKRFLIARATKLADEVNDKKKTMALIRSLVSRFDDYVRLNGRVPPEIILAVSQAKDDAKVVDIISSFLSLKITERQMLLEINNLEERSEVLLALLENEISILAVEKEIRKKVKSQIDKSQREYYLNEQIKAIQTELGEEDEASELDELVKKAEKTKLSKEAKEKVDLEIKKLRKMNLVSPEATVARNYLDWLLNMPWGAKNKIKSDVLRAEKILNKDHYGLDKVKNRILEYLAVQKKTGKIKGPILCLVGPPGVGKTSLGQSIAKATGREFARISLGGMRDEAEIRGHRRTYIGSQPGKIVQSIRKTKTSNPLILLDEVDKIGADWRGDPSSALLEVLDPSQNYSFEDHYLEVAYDLSDVLFITTANTLDMPRPLLDRMEVIRLSGYTEAEKVKIARNYLIPKLREQMGLLKKEWNITDEALLKLIRMYTAEAGVRNLEREIASLMRKAVFDLTKNTEIKAIKVTVANLEKYAGITKYAFGVIGKKDLVGVTTGLAWTEIGGDILSIEALTMAGKGSIHLTGKLGDVMKESIEAAFSFVRSNAEILGIDQAFFEKKDVHVHIPEGAVPKDGPSAGIAMFTSLVSAITKIPVKRDVAMTGEITLSGRILPIGGLKEKLLAAMRGGIKTVIIPQENTKDLAEMPKVILESLEIIPLEKAWDVLNVALVRKPEPVNKKVARKKKETP